MKKIVASFTIFVYIAFSCGVVMNMHYCMNRLQSVDFYVSQNKECSNCGMPMDKKHGCCRDEVKIVKLQDDQNKTQISDLIQPIDITVNIPSEFITASTFISNRSFNDINHSPPLITGQGIYLQNCVFRI